MDLDSGVTPADFIVQRYDAATASWSNTTLSGAPTSTQASITGASSFGTSYSDVAIGKSTISTFTREREWTYQRALFY